jgi:hypothetical protein
MKLTHSPLLRTRPDSVALLASILLALSFSGCASDPHAMARKDVPAATPLNIASSNQAGNAVLQTIIDPYGPGSWKHHAQWDEFVITVTNTGTTPLLIDGAILSSAYDANVPGDDPWELEQGARNRAPGTTATPRTSAIASAAKLSAISSLLCGPSAVGFGAAAIALPTYALATDAADSAGQHRVETEFHRRRLSLPQFIAPGESVTGSLFFPVTRGFRKLNLRGNAEGRNTDFGFDLAAFAHLYHRYNRPEF